MRERPPISTWSNAEIEWRPVVRRSRLQSAITTRQSSMLPSMGAVNVMDRPSADGMTRAGSPGTMSLLIVDPGITSWAPVRFRPPRGVRASEPSAAISQRSER